MKVAALTLREIRLRLKSPFETSFGVMSDRRILLVEARCDGLSGWAEITAGEGPFYSAETVDTAWTIFRDFVAPLLLNADLAGPADVPRRLAPIRGHEMTKAGAECALWDIEAQQKCLSLAGLLGGTRSEISCGVSIGIQHDPNELVAIIEKELASGYQRVKIKIKPGQDLEFIAAAREHFPALKLMADANSAYRLADAAHLQAFDRFHLMMIEQPLQCDDIYEHARLQKQLQTPICLDESIHNLHQSRAAVELGACRVINIKLGRVGGHLAAREIAAFCAQRSIPVWCGGMLESGVGRAHNIAMSAQQPFDLPGDVSASSRYWDEDIIEPEVEVSPQGTIRVPRTPGLGYCVRRERIERLCVRKETFQSRQTAASIAVVQ